MSPRIKLALIIIDIGHLITQLILQMYKMSQQQTNPKLIITKNIIFNIIKRILKIYLLMIQKIIKMKINM